MPKICIFQAVLLRRHRGQNCEFCHIKSRGKNNATSLINKTATDFIFLHMEPIHSIHISLLVLKIIQDLTKCCPS